jgi:hypothetical protein
MRWLDTILQRHRPEVAFDARPSLTLMISTSLGDHGYAGGLHGWQAKLKQRRSAAGKLETDNGR